MLDNKLENLKDKLVSFCRDNMFDSDIELIHKYTTKDSILNDFFRYPVYLCDNDIDRDGECLSGASIETLSEMLVGKPGILGHEWEKLNNHSRIYKTAIYVDDGEIKNKLGESIKCLIGFCYIPINDETESFIDKINSGVINEVSIGFKGNTRCNICGSNVADGVCENGHKMLNEYDLNGKNTLCYGYTDSIEDCFEWSFVSVPCMRNAGVIHTKNYKEVSNMSNKKEGTPLTLEEAMLEIERLNKVIDGLNSDFKVYKKGCAIRKAVDGMGTVAEKATDLICKQLLDVDGIEIDDDGNIVSGAEIIEAVRDDMPFLFISEDDTSKTKEDTEDKVEVTVDERIDENEDTDETSDTSYYDKYKGMNSTKFKSGNSNNAVYKDKLNKPVFGIKF